MRTLQVARGDQQFCNEIFALYQGTTFSRAVRAQEMWGFRVCVIIPAFGKSEGRTADPSTTLRSGRDDNSPWKHDLAFPNKIVIPTGA